MTYEQVGCDYFNHVALSISTSVSFFEALVRLSVCSFEIIPKTNNSQLTLTKGTTSKATKSYLSVGISIYAIKWPISNKIVLSAK